MTLDGYTAFEHALPVALKSDVVNLVAKTQTFYTPTLLVAYGGPWGELYFWQTANPHDDPKLNRFVPHDGIDRMARRHPWIWPSEYHFPTVASGAAAVLRAGATSRFGAHGQLHGSESTGALGMAGEGGPAKGSAMTPMEALSASTILAADKIGFAPDLGSIEVASSRTSWSSTPIPWTTSRTPRRSAGSSRTASVGSRHDEEGVPREEPPPKFFGRRTSPGKPPGRKTVLLACGTLARRRRAFPTRDFPDGALARVRGSGATSFPRRSRPCGESAMTRGSSRESRSSWTSASSTTSRHPPR